MSNEVVENKNQEICKFASAHTNNHANATSEEDSLYYQIMRHMLVQTYCYPATMWEPPSQAPNSLLHCKCGRCKVKGHYKSNKRVCLLHPDYKGPEVLSSDDEFDDDDYVNSSSESESDEE